MIDIKGKKVIVIGLARTGAAVAKRCARLGSRILVLEKEGKPADPIQAATLLSMGIEIRFGAHGPDDLAGADLVIPSPGVSPSTPILQRAVSMGLPIISEIELAFQLTDRPVIAVTGTNGKTTTATLIGELLRADGKAAEVCGNIGRPMIDAPRLEGSAAPLVVEVSSFQLEFTDKFKPHIAVLLNVAPDHLDWHDSLEAYTAAKLKMFCRQTAEDWAVAGADCASLLDEVKAKKVVFGDAGAVFAKDGWIRHSFGGAPAKIMPVDHLALRGGHNLANAMAAASVALIEGVEEEVIAETLRGFKGVEHRLEPVIESGDILFYNDSKATNPAAAITALKAFDEGIILLAGGRNKGNNFEELAREAAGRVRLAVLFGEAAPDLRAAMARHSVATAEAASIHEAVSLAVEAAAPGDVVLLAPACASFDMFADFEERGRAFKAAVRAQVGSVGKNSG